MFIHSEIRKDNKTESRKVKNMLLNLTNHPSANWQEEQKSEAIQRWGSVRDYPFPIVSAEWDEEEMLRYADAIVSEVVELAPEAVLCQGEMNMTYILVVRLQQSGFPVYAATSDRVTSEVLLPDGSVRKQSVFRFVMFRKYPEILS